MAGSFVQVPVDSTGKKLQTFNNTVGSDSVHSEGVTLVRSSDNSEVGVSGQPVRIDPTGTTTQPISDAGGSLTVDGTFFQATQPVSIADGSDTTLGAKADAKSAATDTTAISAMSVLKQISASVQAPPSQAVTNAGTFATQAAQSGTWNITNVSGTVSLPTGAATAAKQPALGSAGSASADVISIQGVASMTAVKVDGSGVTQPVSGTVTANQGGTWTVQPGNTANTTAWKVDGSAVTQPVQSVGNGAILSSQQAVTGSAVALASNACRKALVKALVANTINVYVGPSGITTGTGYELAPGEAVALDIANTNLVFVIASTTGASVSWIATN